MNIIVKVEGRALFPSDMVLGNRGDNDVTALQFMVPQIFGVQSAYAVYKRADTITDTALLDAEGLWPIDRAITGTPGELDVFLRVVSGESDEVWNSNKVRFLIRPLFEITDNTIADDPDELERALGIIGAYAADAGAGAQIAEEWANKAQSRAEYLEFPDVEAVTLSAGSDATAQWKPGENGPILELGIPRGFNGNGEAAQGDMNKDVYDPDGDGLIDQAKTITGTIEINQVSGLGSTLAGKADNSTLLAVDQRLTGHIDDKANPHQVTAQQAGARPDTWLPTLTELGITAGTTDLEAGVSPLAPGTVYIVYE